MKYGKLDKERQRQMLDQRLTAYEEEHFSHQTNKELLIAGGDTSDEAKAAIENADKAMATLDGAHAETVKKLAKITKGDKAP